MKQLRTVLNHRKVLIMGIAMTRLVILLTTVTPIGKKESPKVKIHLVKQHFQESRVQTHTRSYLRTIVNEWWLLIRIFDDSKSIDKRRFTG